MLDLKELLIEAFEQVFPQKKTPSLERLLYISLNWIAYKKQAKTFECKLSDIEGLCDFSETTARKILRELARLGYLSIDERGRYWHKVTLLMGEEICGVSRPIPLGPESFDIESIDFYTDRQWIDSLIRRQQGRCLYSLKLLDREAAELDHIVPLSRGGDNSYRNIGVSSFEMNKRKGDAHAVEFLRTMYRENFLSEEEFSKQITMLDDICSGRLKPEIELG
jgi:hypothetical protein